jgi:hypothetical protein
MVALSMTMISPRFMSTLGPVARGIATVDLPVSGYLYT